MPDDTNPPADTNDEQVDTSSAADTQTDSQKPDTDSAAEIEKWKALARKHEDRAKANASAASELASLRKSAMTDAERLVAEAREAAFADAAKTFGSRLVDAEVRAAAANTSLDVDTLLDGLDRSRFLTDDGEPDAKAIRAWIGKLSPARRADLGQGRRGDNSPQSKVDTLSDFIDSHFG